MIQCLNVDGTARYTANRQGHTFPLKI